MKWEYVRTISIWLGLILLLSRCGDRNLGPNQVMFSVTYNPGDGRRDVLNLPPPGSPGYAPPPPSPKTVQVTLISQDRIPKK